MNSVIVYYSYSGNTHKAAEALKVHLEKTSEVDTIELKAIDESNSFSGQAMRGLVHAKAKINDVETDLSNYNLVCIGTPVWAFGPAPAMNTYLSQIKGLEGKEAIVFTTYGSGTGNGYCIKYIKNILVKKGVKNCKSFTIKGLKIKDNDYVHSVINSHT